MKPHDLLFWIIIGIIIATILLLFSNQLLFNYLKVNINVKP
ncbi:MAG: hypothetical protein QXD43_06130 [Candidatus Aenigmatarchaeota archaeon]